MPRLCSITWTDRMDDMIRDAWANDVATRDVAHRLHISEFSVRNRAYAIGLQPRGHAPRSTMAGVASLQRAYSRADADRAATIEFELAFCDWADRQPGVEICGYRVAA